MLTSTSTDFILLSSKVDHLYHSFDWTLTSLSLIITVTILGIGYVQNLINKRSLKEELSGFKAEVNDSVNRIMDDKALTFKLFSEDEKIEIKKQIELYRESAEADISRNFALSSEDSKFYSVSFGWWLSAAKHFYFIGDDGLLAVSLKGAKRTLEKITKESVDLSEFVDRLDNNHKKLEELEKKNPILVSVIMEIMKEKAKLL